MSPVGTTQYSDFWLGVFTGRPKKNNSSLRHLVGDATTRPLVRVRGCRSRLTALGSRHSSPIWFRDRFPIHLLAVPSRRLCAGCIVGPTAYRHHERPSTLADAFKWLVERRREFVNGIQVTRCCCPPSTWRCPQPVPRETTPKEQTCVSSSAFINQVCANRTSYRATTSQAEKPTIVGPRRKIEKKLFCWSPALWDERKFDTRGRPSFVSCGGPPPQVAKENAPKSSADAVRRPGPSPTTSKRPALRASHV